MLLDEWKEEHHYRLSLFDCSSEGASVPEDWRTALTVGLCDKGVRSEWKETRNVQDVSVMRMELGQKDWWQ